MLEFSEYSKSSPCSNPPENTSDIDMVSAMAETKIVHALSLSKKGTLQRPSVIIEKLGFKWHTLAKCQNRGERTMRQQDAL